MNTLAKTISCGLKIRLVAWPADELSEGDKLTALSGISGAGGFGREVIPVARRQLEKVIPGEHGIDYELVFVVDMISEATVNGYRVIDQESFLSASGERFFNIAIADSKLRESIVESATKRGAKAFEICWPDNVRLDAISIGEGAILCPHVTITSNVEIGDYFHANIYSYIAHDCCIGNYVTFAPGVKCNGRVVIEDHAYIGTGAVLKQGSADKPLRIGANAIVGMGAVVTKDVAPGSVVVGNPARILEKK